MRVPLFSSKLKWMARAVLLAATFRAGVRSSSGRRLTLPDTPRLRAILSLLLWRPNRCWTSGNSSEAESAARRYLEAHQGSADAHYLLGYILFRGGKSKSFRS
jgi:hypothetical protein